MASLLKRATYFNLVFIPFAIAGILVILLTDQRNLFLQINRIHSPAADVFFSYFTWIGNGVIFGIVCVILLFRKLSDGILATASLALSSILAQVLKKVFFPGFHRPLKWFAPEEIHMVEGLKHHLHHSFPSGHSCSVFALCFLLTLLIPDRKWGFVLAFIALLGGYSRIYLAQHFFEDVYAGAWLGVLSTLIVYVLFEKKLAQKASLNKGLLRRT